MAVIRRAAPVLLRAALFLALCCAAALGARAGEPDPDHRRPQQEPVKRLSDFGKRASSANPKDSDLSPEDLHAKALKQMKENQEKAMKAHEEREKKRKKKEEKKDSKTEEENTPQIKGFGSSKAPLVEPPKMEKGKRETAPIDISKLGGKTSHNFVEIKNPKRKEKGRELDDPAKVITNTSEDRQVTIGEIQKKKDKPGFFNRLFGKKDEKPPAVNEPSDGEVGQITNDPKYRKKPKDVTNFVPAPPERRDTVARQLQSEMARKRLESELGRDGAGSGTESGAPQESKAEVVELGSTPTPVPEGMQTPPMAMDEPAAGGAAARAQDNAPATEADIREAGELEYQKGLKSKDVLAREAAFERAALERREDAIPCLIYEVENNKFAAEMAARTLGAIGKLTPDVEGALLLGLGSKDSPVRQACASSLGRLRSHRAVQALMEVLKNEKNYPARVIYVESLGLLGERAAIPALKGRLESPDEIEYVKNSAALALARLGDPSGRAHLIRSLDSDFPAVKVLGLNGIVQLNDPDTAAYLNGALESRYEEVWTAAVYLFPRLGPGLALPVLRTRLESDSELMRRRAALAMGFLGSDDGLPYIDKALREGIVQERVMACELLASLARTDRVPLLVEKLQDPHSSVRQTAAVALTRLNATEAVPALIEAARGLRAARDLPPGLRGAAPDVYETLVLLSCVRILRGEKDDLVITTLPNARDQSWPEVERVLSEQQVELVKLYELVDVIASGDSKPLGAIIKLPNGKEVLFKEGEPVAAGFRVRDIGLPVSGGRDKSKLPAYVTLKRGSETIRLIDGRPPEISGAKAESRNAK